MNLFHKLMLIVMSLQLNVIIFFLNKIDAGNEPVYRFQVLRQYMLEQMEKAQATNNQNKDI